MQVVVDGLMMMRMSSMEERGPLLIVLCLALKLYSFTFASLAFDAKSWKTYRGVVLNGTDSL